MARRELSRLRQRGRLKPGQEMEMDKVQIQHFGVEIPEDEQPHCSGCGGPMRIEALGPERELMWTCIQMCNTPGSEEPVGKEFLDRISTQAPALFDGIKAARDEE